MVGNIDTNRTNNSKLTNDTENYRKIYARHNCNRRKSGNLNKKLDENVLASSSDLNNKIQTSCSQNKKKRQYMEYQYSKVI